MDKKSLGKLIDAVLTVVVFILAAEKFGAAIFGDSSNATAYSLSLVKLAYDFSLTILLDAARTVKGYEVASSGKNLYHITIFSLTCAIIARIIADVYLKTSATNGWLPWILILLILPYLFKLTWQIAGYIQLITDKMLDE